MKKLDDLYRNSDPVLNDALDRISTKILQKKEQNGDQVIVFCGCEPRVGTTTLAINISLALASSGWRTVLVDGDIRKTGVHKRLNSNIGLLNYLKHNIDMDGILEDTHLDSLKYLPGGSGEGNSVRLLNSERFATLVQTLKQEFDFVLFDTPAQPAAVDAEIIARRADATVLVAGWNQTDSSRIQKAKEAIEHAGGRITGVVVNKMISKRYARYNKDYNYFITGEYMKKNLR